MTRPSSGLGPPSPRKAGRRISRALSPLVGERVREGGVRGVSFVRHRRIAPFAALRMTEVAAASRDPRPASRDPASALIDKGHLIDLAQRRRSFDDLADGGLAEELHSFFFRGFLDLRGRTAVEDHAPDPIGEVEELRDSGPAW